MVMLIAAFSCNKENAQLETEKIGNEPKIVDTNVNSFTATIAETKTYLDGLSTKWNGNEWISIFKGTDSYAFGTTDSGTSATFTYAGYTNGAEEATEPTGVVSTSTWALYPYSAGTTFDGTDIAAYINESQALTLGTFSDQHPVLVAKSDAEGNLAFKNATSVIKFTLADATFTDLWIKGNDGEKIAGSFKVSYDGSSLATSVEGAYPKDQIYLTPASGTNFAAGTYYFTVAPTAFPNGFYLEWTDPEWTSNYVPMKKTTKAQEFQANKIIDLGTISKTNDTTLPTATLLSAATATTGVPYTLRVQVSDNMKLSGTAAFLITDSAWSSYYTDIWDHSASTGTSGNYYQFSTDGSGNWIFETTVTFASAGTYVVGTELYDYAGNGAWPNLNITVSDPAGETDAPEVVMNSGSSATVGTPYTLSLTFSDATGIVKCWPKVVVHKNWNVYPTEIAENYNGWWPEVSGTSCTQTIDLTFTESGDYTVVAYGPITDGSNVLDSDATGIILGTITVTDI